MEQPIVDIIIPVFNQCAYTQACLSSIMGTVWIPYRIIMVDDGSRDYTPIFLKEVAKENPVIRILTHKSNMGFTKAINSGLSISDSPYACILNNDTKGWPGWLDELIKVSESLNHSNIGAVIPTLNDWCGRHSVYMNNGVDDTEEIDYLTMTCALITRDAINSVGKLDVELDPIIGSGQSDMDYGIRIQNMGYKIMVARKSLVHHAANQTLKSFECYKNGTYQKENYKELNGLRKKYGNKRIDELIASFWTNKEESGDMRNRAVND